MQFDISSWWCIFLLSFCILALIACFELLPALMDRSHRSKMLFPPPAQAPLARDSIQLQARKLISSRDMTLLQIHFPSLDLSAPLAGSTLHLLLVTDAAGCEWAARIVGDNGSPIQPVRSLTPEISMALDAGVDTL